MFVVLSCVRRMMCVVEPRRTCNAVDRMMIVEERMTGVKERMIGRGGRMMCVVVEDRMIVEERMTTE